MNSFDDTYSRTVARAKIALPLIALGLLSTLFMFSRDMETFQPIPWSEADIEAFARDSRVTGPRYTGMTPDGAALSVSARVARPDPDDERTIRAEALNTLVETADGLRVEIAAGQGAFRNNGRHTTLSGGVTAQTSTGYSIRTGEIILDLDGVLMRAQTPVTAESPLGRLNAGGMTLNASDDEKQSYVLVFNGGVKLIYTPGIEGRK